MSRIKRIQHACMLGAIVLFFLSGTLYTTRNYRNLQMPLLLVSIFLIWLLSGLHMPRYMDKRILRNGYFWFVLSILVSFLAHFEVAMLVSAIGLLLILWTVYDLIPSYYRDTQGDVSEITFLLMGFQIVLLVFSLLTTPFRFSRYRGIFHNQNGMGNMAATLCSISLAALLEMVLHPGKLDKGGKIRAWIYGVISLIGLAVSIIATSRMSFLTIGVMMVLFLLLLFHKGAIRQKRKQKWRILFLVIVTLTAAFFLSGLNDLFTSNIIAKFYATGGNQLNGRMEIWAFLLKRLSFWGNGENTAIAAHSTYFSMLDQYGIPSGAIWLMFMIVSLFKSLRLALRTEGSRMQYLPLFSFTCFAAESLSEGMMLKTTMLVSVFCLAVLANRHGVFQSPAKTPVEPDLLTGGNCVTGSSENS